MISSFFVAFSEYMNFTRRKLPLTWTSHMAHLTFFYKETVIWQGKNVFFSGNIADLFYPKTCTRQKFVLKFINSEKATKFCKIFNVDLFYVVLVKSRVEILQNFVAFSECMNFN